MNNVHKTKKIVQGKSVNLQHAIVPDTLSLRRDDLRPECGRLLGAVPASVPRPGREPCSVKSRAGVLLVTNSGMNVTPSNDETNNFVHIFNKKHAASSNNEDRLN